MHSLFVCLATLASLITTPIHVTGTTFSPSSEFRPSHILFHLLLDQDTTQYNVFTQINHPLLEPFTSIGSNQYGGQLTRSSNNNNNNNNNNNTSHYVIINLEPSYLDHSEQSFFGLETFDEFGAIRTCVIGVSMNEYDKQIQIDTVVQNGLTCYIPQRRFQLNNNENDINVAELSSLLYHLPLSAVVDDSMNSYCYWNEEVKSCVPNWYGGREDEIVEERDEERYAVKQEEEEEEEEVETEQRQSAGKAEAQGEGEGDYAESDSASFTAVRHTKSKPVEPEVTRTHARASIVQPKGRKEGVASRCFHAVCKTVGDDIKSAGGPGKVIGRVTGTVVGSVAGSPGGHVGMILGGCVGGYVGGKVGHCVEEGVHKLRHKGK